MLSDFSLALIPPGGKQQRRTLRWFRSPLFLSVSMTQLHPDRLRLLCCDNQISTSGSLDYRVCVWMGGPRRGSCLSAELPWLAGSESVWLRPEPMTHSCSLSPDLWAGPLCSVGQCWVAEWVAEQEAVGSLLGGSTGIWLVLGPLAPRSPSVCPDEALAPRSLVLWGLLQISPLPRQGSFL